MLQGILEEGHCVSIVGYDDTRQCWIAKNSWGDWWGKKGFFKIGYGECGIDAAMWAIEGVTKHLLVPILLKPIHIGEDTE